MGLLDFLNPVKAALTPLAGAAKFIGERLLPAKKMTEVERSDNYVKIFQISESSTDSARKMYMTAMQTQKQSWLIKFLNGLVRPFGGLGALTTEFYAIWGENFAEWFDFTHKTVTITTPQHLVLGSIIAFYFGSRLKETLSGASTRR